MKTVALDPGDRWVGVAISDAMGIIARPYDTAEAGQLIKYIAELLEKERIGTIVVGHPRTLRGTDSAQTIKVVALFNKLKNRFPNIKWELWDERLSSKQALGLGKSGPKTHEQKTQGAQTVHAKAAALILNTYLEFQAFEYQANNTLDSEE